MIYEADLRILTSIILIIQFGYFYDEIRLQKVSYGFYEV